MNPILDKAFCALTVLMALYCIVAFLLWLPNRKSAVFRNMLVGGGVGFGACLLSYASGIF